jgi:opacity protein-like surface antigen
MRAVVGAAIAAIAFAIFAPSTIRAQETTTAGSQAQSQKPPAPAPSPWSFSVSPYVWFAGMTGNVGVNPNLPAIDVDVSFGDIFENIDWFPPPVMVVGEVRYDRFAAFTDFIYLGLDSNDEVTKGPVAAAVDLELNTIVWTFGGAYRVIDSERGHLGLLAGGRLWNVDADGSLIGPLAVRQHSGSKTWVDPIIGINGRIELGAGFALQAEADVGGFGVASDIDWQVMGTVQYEIAESVALAAGYRYLAVDFDDGGFLYDVALHGPIIGATIRF